MRNYPYDNEAFPQTDQDQALAATLRIPGYHLSHEPNELCWCDPIIIQHYDEDGDPAGFTYEHRTMQ